MSEYQKQAEDFLAKTGTTIAVKFYKNGLHFNTDTEPRDIYNVILLRGDREMTLQFGQSIANSGFYIKYGARKIDIPREYLSYSDSKIIANRYKIGLPNDLQRTDKIHRPQEPDAYTILSCLSKYDSGTFADFCSEFGCNTDSRKAYETYKAVSEEYSNLCRLFSSEEMEELRQIQ